MALARAASSGNDGLEDWENLDVNTIVDKIVKLKGQLKLVNERSERPVNIDGNFLGFLNVNGLCCCKIVLSSIWAHPLGLREKGGLPGSLRQNCQRLIEGSDAINLSRF